MVNQIGSGAVSANSQLAEQAIQNNDPSRRGGFASSSQNPGRSPSRPISTADNGFQTAQLDESTVSTRTSEPLQNGSQSKSPQKVPFQTQRTTLELQTRKLRLAGLQNRLNQLLNQSGEAISNESVTSQAPDFENQTSPSNTSVPNSARTATIGDRPSGTTTNSRPADSSSNNSPITLTPRSNDSPVSTNNQGQLQERLQTIDQQINKIQFRQLRTLLRDATEPVSQAENLSRAVAEAQEVLEPGSGIEDLSEQESTTLPTSIPLSPGQIINTRG